MEYYCQLYTCESGAVGKILIPECATEDDLKGIKEMLDIIIKRHFKMEEVNNHEIQNRKSR